MPTNRSEERLALKIDGDKAFGGTDEHLAISEKAATSLRTLGRTAVRVSGSDCERSDITHRTPTFGAMPMPWCRRDRDATTLRRVRRRFSVSVERSRTTGWSGFAENAAQRVLRALFLRFAVISAFFPHRPRQRGAELHLPPLSLPLTQPCGEKTSPSAIAEGRDPCKRDAFFLHLARVIVN